MFDIGQMRNAFSAVAAMHTAAALLGLLSVLFESILIGVWWAAIGVFLRRAALRASA